MIANKIGENSGENNIGYWYTLFLVDFKDNFTSNTLILYVSDLHSLDNLFKHSWRP